MIQRFMRWCFGAISLAAPLVMTGTAQATNLDSYLSNAAAQKAGTADVNNDLINALAAAAAGDGFLVVAKGYYRVAASPVVALPINIAVVGATPRARTGGTASSTAGAVFFGDSSTVDLLQLPTADNYNTNTLIIKDIGFYSARKALYRTVTVVEQTPNLRVSNCWFKNINTAAITTNISGGLIDRCVFEDCAIGIEGASVVPGGWRSSAVHVVSCTFKGCTSWAISMGALSSSIRECYFENCSGGGVYLWDAYAYSQGVVSGCTFKAVGTSTGQPIWVQRNTNLASIHTVVRENGIFAGCGRAGQYQINFNTSGYPSTGFLTGNNVGTYNTAGWASFNTPAVLAPANQNNSYSTAP